MAPARESGATLALVLRFGTAGRVYWYSFGSQIKYELWVLVLYILLFYTIIFRLVAPFESRLCPGG